MMMIRRQIFNPTRRDVAHVFSIEGVLARVRQSKNSSPLIMTCLKNTSMTLSSMARIAVSQIKSWSSWGSRLKRGKFVGIAIVACLKSLYPGLDALTELVSWYENDQRLTRCEKIKFPSQII